jgi:lysophospholipase L1-like esterase
MVTPTESTATSSAEILPDPWPIQQNFGRRRIALIGHSYVRRLRDYMDKSGLGNMGFAIEDARVYAFCRGGAAVRVVSDDRWAYHLLQPATLFHPSVVYVHVGENDLGHVTPATLVDHLINFVRSIITFMHPDVVIFSQLFPLPQQVVRHDITSINEALSSALDSLNQNPNVVVGNCVTRVVFLKHTFGIWGSRSADLFHGDGIHLTDVGMSRYYFSVRNAVGKALGSL